jgi:hypothetical protein
MRKVFFLALLFASTIAVAQDIQDSFFGYKLDNNLKENDISYTIQTKYSNHIGFYNDHPRMIGRVEGINFGGYKWEQTNIIIYKPMQKFQGVEFTQTGTVSTSLKKRYEELLATLTEKYGEPGMTDKTIHQWTGKNGVNVRLEYRIEVPSGDSVSTLSQALGQESHFDTVVLKYWSSSVEEKVRQYEKDQL